jgi:hypothetical protein
MGMPPVDLASGDKHARSSRPRQGGRRARHRQRSAWKCPSFWLVRATVETPTPPARGTGTLTTPSNVMDSRRPMGSPLLTSAPYVEQENGRLSALTEMGRTHSITSSA